MTREFVTARNNRGIRLIAIDLDGTLLNSAGQLPRHSCHLIQKAFGQGIRIILSTTQNYKDVERICAVLAIDDPIICSNGAYIFEEPGGALWQKLCLPVPVAERICQVADENNWELSISNGELTYFNQRPGQEMGQLAENIEVVPSNCQALVDQPHRILTWQPQALEGLRTICLKEFQGVCRTEIFYRPDGELHSLGIFAWGADKGSALAFVLAKIGISTHQVMAIGDNRNDLPMFDLAEVKVAMGNAIEEIKQVATIIAPSNEDEGVAWVLENYVF
jgi:hypothetical protein